jgi:putative membrane protein
MIDLKDLPTVNASLNLMALTSLLCGWRAIKMKRVQTHWRFMLLALVFSGLFLCSYLYYHYQVGHKSFPELGWIKTLYLLILFPHIALAVLMLPFIFLTFYRAWKGEWTKHKKIARITLPVWLYVSFSGVLVYLMLYHFFA